MLNFFLGLIAGASLTVFCMALFTVASIADDREEMK